MTQAQPKAYTPQEAAQLLGVSRTTLYEYMASGALRSFRLGRLRRISAQAIADFIEAAEAEAEAERLIL